MLNVFGSCSAVLSLYSRNLVVKCLENGTITISFLYKKGGKFSAEFNGKSRPLKQKKHV
jgi:hypothetical protein